MRTKPDVESRDLEEVVLFAFDDYALPLQSSVRLCLHPGRMPRLGATNIVVPMGEPGEPDSVILTYYGSVRRVGDELWMWYCGQGDGENEWHQRVCHARSKDGRRWEKPRLGLVEYKGSKDNNLVDIGDAGHVKACVVFYEPDDPDPDRRFKMSYECSKYRAELAVAFSRDGLTWKEHPGNPVGPAFEQAGGTKFNGIYYVNGQGWGHWSPKGRSRKLVTHISYDFENWSQAGCMGLRRDSLPPRPTEYGLHHGPQVHLGAAIWNRGNTLVGFYGMWNGHPSNDRRETWMNLGLAVSHDALHFREPIPDFAIVEATESNWNLAFKSDAAAQFPALIQGQGFENIGEETLFWYALWPEHDSDGVRLTTWPRDRLGHLESFTGPDEPHIVSQPILLEGRPARIHLNVDGLSQHAEIKVSLLNEKLHVLDGYDSEACSEPKQSGFRQLVKWGNKETVVSDEPIRVKVEFRGVRPEDVKLYAVYVGGADRLL